MVLFITPLISSLTRLLGSFTGILASLVLLLVLQALPDYTVLGSTFLNILFSAVILIGSFLVIHESKLLRLIIICAIPAFCLRWVSYISGTFPGLTTLSFSLDAIFLSFLCIVIVHHVLSARQVTYDILSGAISVYLLLGFIFMSFYTIIEIHHPGSFSYLGVSASENLEGRSLLLYYSFVTLTTLGFGDMIPTTNLARTITLLQAVIGQMYIAILVARLVGASLTPSGCNREHR